MTSDSTELTMFDNMPEAYRKAVAELEPEDNMTGGEFSTNRRLGVRGSVFRKVVNGKEVSTLEERSVNVVIIKAGPVYRMYYEGKYVPGETKPPTCWADDSNEGRPSPNVLASNKQSSSCVECPQNVKGSGQNDTKACRYHQRFVVAFVDDLEHKELYRLDLAATSIFGQDPKKMASITYARYMHEHKTPVAAVVTELRFDPESSTPKLCFKPVRPLEPAELSIVSELQKSEEASRMLEIKVKTEEDSEVAEPQEAKAPGKEKDEEEPSEPKVAASKGKTAAAPKDEESLDSVLNKWDDED